MPVLTRLHRAVETQWNACQHAVSACTPATTGPGPTWRTDSWHIMTILS